MTVRELAKEVHRNAVEHGWWDSERDDAEVIALIHSEWSEALEEARAGRAMRWYACKDNSETHPHAECIGSDCIWEPNGCKYRDHKPEGIAVELIDGCIRILDALGDYSEMGIVTNEKMDSDITELYGKHMHAPGSIGTLVALLHLYTSRAYEHDSGISLMHAMMLAMAYVRDKGMDPLSVLLEKHEFNKGRPYKHGKKF